jgi:hypothetical protein
MYMATWIWYTRIEWMDGENLSAKEMKQAIGFGAKYHEC